MSRSLLVQVWEFPALGREGAARLLSLTLLSSNAPIAATVSDARPVYIPISLKNLFTTYV